jgi:hypothetical protein
MRVREPRYVRGVISEPSLVLALRVGDSLDHAFIFVSRWPFYYLADAPKGKVAPANECPRDAINFRLCDCHAA